LNSPVVALEKMVRAAALAYLGASQSVVKAQKDPDVPAENLIARRRKSSTAAKPR